MARVTIAIPFHDEERRLPAAIRSVFAQTFADWELLLMDDGSRDSSVRIARSVDDPRVRVVSDGRLRGLPARLNEVIAIASSELIARMDADDVMHPQRLERQLALFAEQPALDCIGTQVAFVLPSRPPIIADVAAPRSGADVLARSGVPHATMLGQRRFFQRFPYDQTFTRAEDRELFCRSWGSARLAIVKAPLYVVEPEVDSDAFLRGYLESARQNRAIYLRHGPTLVGIPQTARAMLGSYARDGVYRVAAQLGGLEALVACRGREATADERRMIDEALDASRTTRVPGL